MAVPKRNRREPWNSPEPSTNGSKVKVCPAIASATTGNSKKTKSTLGLNPARLENKIRKRIFFVQSYPIIVIKNNH